ncbi:MAG TPA: hypothetical protein VMU14_15505 [Acidimicrobiales bacterium]|nr:hypothetical protein [Acidimicrobiales bacterium]
MATATACSAGGARSSRQVVAPTTAVTTSSASTSAPPPARPPEGRVWALTGTPTTAGPPRTASLVPVDEPAGHVGTPVALPTTAAGFVAIDRAGTAAYVIDRDSPGRVVPVHLPTGVTGAAITLPVATSGGSIITSVAFSADDRTAYFVDAGAGQLDPVDLVAGTAAAPIPIAPLAACGDVETQAVATPDDKGVYVEGPSGLYDVDLTARHSSPSFDIAAHDASGAYGNMAISLDAGGQRLYVLQPGMQSDTLVAVGTNGDAALSTVTVPVGPRAQAPPSQGDLQGPAWDKVFVASSSIADVIEYGSVPEQIVRVALPAGTVVGRATLSPVTGLSACGDQSPVPLAILPDNATAVAAGPGAPDVHGIDLASGGNLATVSTGRLPVLAVLSGSGWPDSWPN